MEMITHVSALCAELAIEDYSTPRGREGRQTESFAQGNVFGPKGPKTQSMLRSFARRICLWWCACGATPTKIFQDKHNDIAKVFPCRIEPGGLHAA